MYLARVGLCRFSKSVLFNTSIGSGDPKKYAEVSNSGETHTVARIGLEYAIRK